MCSSLKWSDFIFLHRKHGFGVRSQNVCKSYLMTMMSRTSQIITHSHEIVIFIHDLTSLHYSDAIMTTMASQITSLAVVYSTVYSDADQRKHRSSASLAFMRGIHRGPVNSPHKGPVTRKMFHDLTLNYYPLFRVSSWNNGIRCMFFYILMTSSCQHCIADMTKTGSAGLRRLGINIQI